MAAWVAMQIAAQVTGFGDRGLASTVLIAPAMRSHMASLVALSLIGCAGAPDIEDPETDVFLTEDAKADAFGVEDWSPDGAAVLELVSEASATKLHDEVGLSARVAKAIVAQRTALGGKIDDLADLDDAKFVGKTVFKQLLRFVTERHLFKTALRVPLAIDDGNGKLTSISSFNAQAKAAQLTGFARYTFVDTSTKFSEKMSSYDARLQALAAKAHITIEGEMVAFASSLNDFTVGSQVVCYIGDPKQVADVSASQSDSMMGDMYIVWGWRHKKTKTLDDQIEDAGDADDFFGSDWTDWNTASNDVLIMSTNSDSGDNPGSAVVPPCR